MFTNGWVAMQEGTFGPMTQFRTVKTFTWDVTFMPTHKGGIAATGGGVGYGMPRGAKHHDWAWELVKFKSGPEGQLILAKAGAAASCLKSVSHAPVVLATRPPAHLKLIMDLDNDVQIDPPLDNWPEIDDHIEAEMDLLYSGTRSAREVGQRIVEIVNPLLKQSKHA